MLSNIINYIITIFALIGMYTVYVKVGSFILERKRKAIEDRWVLKN